MKTHDYAKLPNFFIIGAPKCGTTSLVYMLKGHKNVYIPEVKEPHYYLTDLNYRAVSKEEEYLSLFNRVSRDHIAIGEASVWYLFSREAVKNIEIEYSKMGKLPKYIVILRNPVDMVYSLHEQMVYNGAEGISDFSEAWKYSSMRRKGVCVKGDCREPRILDYQTVGKFGQQLERLFQIVDKKRVLVLILDDVIQNPRREYLKILSFLGLKDDHRNQFPRVNTAKELRSRTLRMLIRRYGGYAILLKKRLGLGNVRFRVFEFLNMINTRYRPRKPMRTEIRRQVLQHYYEDICLLEDLLQRDLSKWKELEDHG